MSQPPDPSVVFFQKALEDVYLAKRVKDDMNISVEQMGFLCQQAIEKALEAVLSHHNVRFRRGHDLAQYLNLLKAASIIYPSELELARNFATTIYLKSSRIQRCSTAMRRFA